MILNANTIPVKGRTVRYYEAGEPHRRALLLLHGGFGAAALHWEEVSRTLKSDYYIIAPDMPGYGETEPLPQMTIDAMVDWVRDLLDALGLDDVVVVANSFSGLIGRLLAVKHPRYAPVVVLVNGGVIPNISGIARFVAKLPLIGSSLFNRLAKSMTKREDLALGIGQEAVMTDAFIEKVQAERTGLAKMMHMLASSPKPEKTVPPGAVLLLWGEDDAITPLVSGKTINRVIPHAQLEVIANCRHMPHIEEPDIFLWQLQNFLNHLEDPKL